MIAISAARLFDGRNEHEEAMLLIEDGRITAIAADAPPGVPVEELHEDAILVPGFIDLQVNGGGGIMFNDETTAEGLARIAAAHARAGTTAILPTLISSTREHIARAMGAVRAARAAAVPGMLGLHLEGPFLAAARRGIHPLSAITAMTPDDVQMLSAPFSAPLLVTLAPDAVAPEDIAALVRAGIIVFAGHTDASWEQARAGLDAGIRGATHLFNAMSPFQGRAPGMVGAVLDDGRAYAGIIADGHHVHPAALRVALNALGAERLFLVSDAMATAASEATGFTLAGERITLRDGMLTNDAGTLAGAHLTMAAAVRNFVAFTGADWTTAVRMATATPAECLGVEDRGVIAVGARADLVVLDDDLNVLEVWQDGQRL
ncbi:MAG: N-acetylglucosamine-6-phosphate deacetylase [Acetobacteraceae bacterium]|nr:N-acetylglucosamine-6-phosphate deacetylase [Acetobacteraceae bacterium]